MSLTTINFYIVCCGNISFISTSGRASPTETKSERSSQTQATGVSSAGGPTSLGSRLPGLQTHVQKAPEAFMSLQLEKVRWGHMSSCLMMRIMAKLYYWQLIKVICNDALLI